jgi:hypothetical protein
MTIFIMLLRKLLSRDLGNFNTKPGQITVWIIDDSLTAEPQFSVKWQPRRQVEQARLYWNTHSTFLFEKINNDPLINFCKPRTYFPIYENRYRFARFRFLAKIYTTFSR